MRAFTPAICRPRPRRSHNLSVVAGGPVPIGRIARAGIEILARQARRARLHHRLAEQHIAPRDGHPGAKAEARRPRPRKVADGAMRNSSSGPKIVIHARLKRCPPTSKAIFPKAIFRPTIARRARPSLPPPKRAASTSSPACIPPPAGRTASRCSGYRRHRPAPCGACVAAHLRHPWGRGLFRLRRRDRIAARRRGPAGGRAHRAGSCPQSVRLCLGPAGQRRQYRYQPQFRRLRAPPDNADYARIAGAVAPRGIDPGTWAAADRVLEEYRRCPRPGRVPGGGVARPSTGFPADCIMAGAGNAGRWRCCGRCWARIWPK